MTDEEIRGYHQSLTFLNSQLRCNGSLYNHDQKVVVKNAESLLIEVERLRSLIPADVTGAAQPSEATGAKPTADSPDDPSPLTLDLDALLDRIHSMASEIDDDEDDRPDPVACLIHLAGWAAGYAEAKAEMEDEAS